jgi:hypothetical protein
MQRRPAALGGWDKFMADPSANVSPMQHICKKEKKKKKDNYIVAYPLKF